jgi:hypothetical protein
MAEARGHGLSKAKSKVERNKSLVLGAPAWPRRAERQASNLMMLKQAARRHQMQSFSDMPVKESLTR